MPERIARPQLYKWPHYDEVIFAKRVDDDHLEGFNVNGKGHRHLYHSTTWCEDFESLCDHCTERACNQGCFSSTLGCLCTPTEIEAAKKAYNDRYPKEGAL